MTSYRIIGVLGLLLTLLFSCEHSGPNVMKYHDTVNQAELQIAGKNFEGSAELYEDAFDMIDKPFGKDLYNAVIVNSIIGDQKRLGGYLKILINNTEDLSFIESTLVGSYISKKEWDEIISQREIAYDTALRSEMLYIAERDQWFRPQYDTHMDTIEKIRKENLDRIFKSIPGREFPGHQEIGYSRTLREQPHHIVLHHTAQRRSQDKSVGQLDEILKDAVYMGKLDPEQAISYLEYQEDLGAGPYEIFAVFQMQHPLLHDSLQDKTWEKTYDKFTRIEADSVRKTWLAGSLGDLSIKAKYLKTTQHPFIFPGIQRNIYELSEEMSEEEVIKYYEIQTSGALEY